MPIAVLDPPARIPPADRPLPGGVLDDDDDVGCGGGVSETRPGTPADDSITFP